MARKYRSWEEQYSEDNRYEAAVRRVKRIKGFYTHLLVYLLVNAFIVFLNIQDMKEGESYFQIKNFFTAICWGIGLLAHGIRVFGYDLFFGQNWENRKIREYMDKEKKEKWE
ncbi:2TM domain-containing protein [Flavobacterium cerinum]|uniref:2TM domain-containing protein n=1 Tax=Flavobacterium cerinum TaxID=2502784 RepID=A0ABY5IUX0_9FLAO|nr:2TM domain-containing protein [Flavobacterium cerinum]UUC45332.1 2TM domain-containing protein [Flavobacterium cerinum]